MKKTRKQLETEISELQLVKEEYHSLMPRIEAFGEIKGYWKTLPFLPEDMGFEHSEVIRAGSPTMDVYHKGEFGAVWLSNGLWLIKKGEEKMNFKISNKFQAYVILSALGFVLEETENKNPAT